MLFRVKWKLIVIKAMGTYSDKAQAQSKVVRSAYVKLLEKTNLLQITTLSEKIHT